MRSFRLHEPTSVAEATSLLARHGEAATAYAGGTELLLAMKAGLLRYEHLVNVKTVPGLDEVAYDDATGVLRIGPAATHRGLETSPLIREHYPLIADMERRVANVRVRNVGTMGGNLCFAEPHSDPGALLLLFDAWVEVTGASGGRTLSLEAMQTGPYQTALKEGELLTRIVVPPLSEGMRGAYLKFGYHHRPTLGMGVALRLSPGDGASIEEVCIALGAVGPRPVRAREAEERIRGERVADVRADGDSSLLAEAGALAARAAEPVGDMHGSAEYKEHLVKVLLGRAIASAIES